MSFGVLPHPSNPKPRRSFPKKDHAASIGSSRVAGEEGTATLERLFQHPDIKKIVPVTYSINCRLANHKARSVNTLVYQTIPPSARRRCEWPPLRTRLRPTAEGRIVRAYVCWCACVCVCVCVCVLFFALWRMVFPGCVGIRKAMRVVSRMRDGRVGGRRRGRPRYSYNAGRSGVFYFQRVKGCLLQT